MRAIKFRAWSDFEELMSYDVTVYANSWYGVVFPNGYEAKYIPNSGLKVMQYTGLVDKNGTEIYEGDILKVTNGAEEMEGTDTGIGVVEWLDKWGFWNVSDIENGLSDLMHNGYVEVIGNIYEDKHLLD